MTAVWMRLRAEVRARWRAMVGLAALLAIMAGAATAAAVGARRTETAYPRFAERYRAFDLLIATGRHPRTEEIFSIAEGLPQVEGTARKTLYTGSVRTAKGQEASFPDVFFFADTEGDTAHPRTKLVSGRMSNSTRPDEAMVNYAMASRLDIRPGETVTMTFTGQEELTGEEGRALPPISLRIRITGTFAAVGSFETVTGSGVVTTFAMTPAFDRQRSQYHFENEDLFGVRLRNGEADARAFIADLHRELARADLTDGLDGDPVLASKDLPGVQGLNRVPAVALWILCGAIAITALAVFSQLFTREIRIAAPDHSSLHAIGFSRSQLLILSILRSGVIAGAGAIGSVVIAYLLSPLTPVGLARIAEPDPGFLLAPRLLALGMLATVVLMTAAAVPAAWGAARWSVSPLRSTTRARPTFLASWLARTPFGLSTRSGLHMAVEAGRGDRALPLRTAVLGTTIAIGALTAALTFAVSLKYLIREPKLAGYSWDAGAIANGFDAESQAASMRRLQDSVGREMPGARLWKGTVFAGASVEGIDVGTYVSDGPPPEIIEGRAPVDANEIALDPRTLRRLGKRLGAWVDVAPLLARDVASPSVRMRVVGLFAVPRIAFQGINPGQGVALSSSGFARMNPTGGYDTLFVDFPARTDFDRELKGLRAAAGDAAFAIVNRNQSATVGNVERISSLPNVLAGMMGVLGLATLVHALSTTIRRRRRDLAILKTLGFVGREVRATVAWQSTGLIIAALLVGLPTGVALGRWGWRLFAASLQVVPVPVVSSVALAAIAASALLLGNVIAAFPARAAARTRPALVLRTE